MADLAKKLKIWGCPKIIIFQMSNVLTSLNSKIKYKTHLYILSLENLYIWNPCASLI